VCVCVCVCGCVGITVHSCRTQHSTRTVLVPCRQSSLLIWRLLDGRSIYCQL